MRLAFIAIVAAALAAGPAIGKTRDGHRPHGASSKRTVADVRPRVCQPLCEMDMSPCDPPEFKRADGRCAGPVTDVQGF